MRIYTRIVLDMTQDDLPVVESESYEYDGPMALCGRDSDASGGSANGGNGEGNENEGRDGGDGGSRNDSFGWGGNVGLNGPAPSTRSTASIEKELSDRELANNVGWGLSAVGLAVPGLGLAGSLARQAAKNGRSYNDWSSMEKAADANGMGEGERGRSSDSDKYTDLPQGLVDYLNQNLAPKDDSYKSIADIINAARDKAGLNNTAETTPVETAPVDYSSILNKYSGPYTAKPVQNNPSVQPGLGVQPVSNVAGFDASLPAYQKAPAAKAINGGDMNGGTSLISGRRTLA